MSTYVQKIQHKRIQANGAAGRQCWNYQNYVLAFAGNNNPAALRGSLVIRNPLGLELISHANPFKGQSDILCVYMLSTGINVIAAVNRLHSPSSTCLLAGCTTLTLNKSFLSYVCYRSLDAQDSIFSVHRPSSEELHVLFHRTLLHLQNVGSNQAPRKESINAVLGKAYKIVFNLLCYILIHIDSSALSVRCSNQKKSPIIFWHQCIELVLLYCQHFCISLAFLIFLSIELRWAIGVRLHTLNFNLKSVLQNEEGTYVKSSYACRSLEV